MFPRFLYLLPLLFMFSCGPQKEVIKTLSSQEKMDLLIQKAERYKQLIKEVQGPSGFIEYESCDSLLFSSLASVGGAQIDIHEAEFSAGRWFRRPISLPECYANGLSRSTISRDQLLGVLWWAYRYHQPLAVERLWDYGLDKKWIMGEDAIGGGHSLFVPLIPLLSRLRNFLNNEKLEPLWSSLPLVSETDLTKTGFEAHLQILQILLDSKFRGGYSIHVRAVLQNHAKRQPNNPLFQYAAGNVAGAVDILLNESYWPADRLPTSQDRFSPWLLERDFGPDWEPGGDYKKHSGADLLFMVYLIRAGF